MKTLQQEIRFLPDSPISNEIFTESSFLFDIETTGFSAKHSFVYLIGCAYRQGNTLFIEQFFAEKDTDETEIIEAFFELAKQFQSIITFNGLGFDLPYLQKRCELLALDMDLSHLYCIDIYKILSKFKKIFKLENLKQKSLETFLGISRKDIYSGGELINIYMDFQQEKDEELLQTILLHNAEDLSGMTDLLPLLSYAQFFQGNYTLSSYERSSFQEYDNSVGLELIFTLTSKYPFPKRISYGFHSVYMTGFQSEVKLKVKIYQGELKYFYSNYKDYYYLPDEDMAVHKSVAFYVDREFRTQAKAATCYSKKTGCFLPQYTEVFDPYFKREYKDKHSYFEMTSEISGSNEKLTKYVEHILNYMLAK